MSSCIRRSPHRPGRALSRLPPATTGTLPPPLQAKRRLQSPPHTRGRCPQIAQGPCFQALVRRRHRPAPSPAVTVQAKRQAARTNLQSSIHFTRSPSSSLFAAAPRFCAALRHQRPACASSHRLDHSSGEALRNPGFGSLGGPLRVVPVTDRRKTSRTSRIRRALPRRTARTQALLQTARCQMVVVAPLKHRLRPQTAREKRFRHLEEQVNNT